MARYTDAVCRICRREGTQLYLKGQKCYGPKCTVQKKAYPPGQGGEQRAQRRRPSDYGLQLREKQKMRAIYGLLEKQFRRYVGAALRAGGVTGEVLMQLLERRLDNIVYRAGFAASRAEGRQLVSHGHFTVNNGLVNIPSYQVRAGDVVRVKESDRSTAPFKELKSAGGRPIPEWITVEYENYAATVNAIPTREQIDTEVDEQQVVEFYSR
ncbi:MAG: 30S ribosomal protein S4 [Armatimonadetes bacterium]|nr:30S ribosomal protein S4 [Armatimonadota bacterium]